MSKKTVKMNVYQCKWCEKEAEVRNNGMMSMNGLEFFMWHHLDEKGLLIHNEGFTPSPLVPIFQDKGARNEKN